MKILLEWIKQFVEIPVRVERLRHDLTMCGVAVEGVEESPAGTLLELDLTTNRPDLLGHYGVAREVSVLYGKPLKKINPAVREVAETASAAARVEIADPDLCHRYVALVFRNVQIKAAPESIRQRLEACGIASINNVVDATNYVLLELGHPTHAFDLDTLAERRIVVRRARAGEKLTTLDGIQRTLKPHQLVIADARRAVALAGIMGGAETEISFRTRNVLLESAWFDPITIRRAAKELGLRTEASYRFERGMDPEAPLMAARRCAELIAELAGGEVLAGAIDVYPRRWPRSFGAAELVLRRSEILRVLGVPVPDEVIERVLGGLGFSVEPARPARLPGGQAGGRTDKESWRVQVASWRRDVTREIDLVEELARHYGYDKFPARLPATRTAAARTGAEKEAAVRETLEALGYDEAVNFSLVHPNDAQRFSPSEPIRLANPLSEEVSVLRTTGLVSMAHTLAWNVNRGERNVRFYEIGKAYGVESGKRVERRVLTLGATGLAQEKSVYAAARTYDFFDLKGAVEAVLERFELSSVRVESPSDGGPFDPALTAAVWASKERLGVCGQLSRAVAADYKLRQAVFLAELDLEALYAHGLRTRRYQPLSRFPAIERDFSLLLDDAVSFAAVRAAIEKLKIAELVSVTGVDRYRGAPVPRGHYSLLVRVRFQSAEQTLTDAEVNVFSERIVRTLEKELRARLRA
ncbi:MAG: phenylalanine--tRNA ligase subunit beta [Terriglobia bacterium]